MTNFKAVSQFNELIGNAKGAATVDQIKKQLALIKSEFEELETAIKLYDVALLRCEEHGNDGGDIQDVSCSLIEIRDGIADVLVTTYGLAHRMGIDADADMYAVCKSNNSKFFVGDEYDAKKVSYAMSVDLGINVEARQRELFACGAPGEVGSGQYVWAFVSADDSDPERPRGKLLKAPGYKPPVFD